jgi:hypothetical protein
MCGIVGVLRFGEAPLVPSYNMSALYLATNLLESSESRGGDATGVTALFDNGNFFIQKMAIGAAEFVTRSGGKPDDYEGLLAILRGYSNANIRCFLGHCRKKSAGALSNVDNHPIKAGNIVGVHNGTLKNDKEVFKNLECERDGKVDSEAIFRLLEYYTKGCTNPFTKEAVVETCTRLEGTYSYLAFNANNPYQVVSARDGRPAEYCLVKPLGIVLIASETKFFDRTLWSYNKMARNFPTGNPETAFIALRKDDVEYGNIANDTAAIFDLTKEIMVDTKLEDLYETEKIPTQVKPNWKSSATKIYNNNTYTNGYSTVNKHHSADKGNGSYSNGFSGGNGEKKSHMSTTNKTVDTAKKDDASDNFTGKVWDSKLEKLVTVFGKKELVNHGIVTDVEKGTNSKLKDTVTTATLDSVDADDAKKTTEADSGMESGDVTAKVSTSDNKLFFATEAGVVEQYSVNEKVPVVRITPPDTNTTNKEAVEDIKKGINKVKNAVTAPIRANDAAIQAAKNLEKFDNDDELATFIGIDTSSLGQLPASSLANRIIKRLFAKFFVEGWEACSKEQSVQSSDVGGEKLSKAMKHIRVLKHLNTSLDSIVETFNAEEINEAKIVQNTRLIASALMSEYGEISKEVLQDIFSAGDFRKSKVLRSIVTSMD